MIISKNGEKYKKTLTDHEYPPKKLPTFLRQALAFNDRTAVTNGTAKTIRQINLTPGVWLISGEIVYVSGHANTVFSLTQAAVSLINNTMPDNNVFGAPTTEYLGAVRWGAVTPGNGNVGPSAQISPYIVSISANTTLYLVARTSFSGSSAAAAACGFISAVKLD